MFVRGTDNVLLRAQAMAKLIENGDLAGLRS